MSVSEARKKANKKYDAKTYDQVSFRFPKGKKEQIQAAASAEGLSLNAYVSKAIDERMARPAPERKQTDTDDCPTTEPHTETGIEVSRRLAKAQGWTPRDKSKDESTIEVARRLVKERQQAAGGGYGVRAEVREE